MVRPRPLGPSIQAFLSTLHRFRSTTNSSIIDLPHRLSTTSLRQHLYIHKPRDTFHNTLNTTRSKKYRHNITWYIQLTISINKHMWTMNSTEKVWGLSTLASIIHHRTRPSHFLTSLSMRECPTRWQSGSWHPRPSKCHWGRQRPSEG